jgi:hypothetical protein
MLSTAKINILRWIATPFVVVGASLFGLYGPMVGSEIIGLDFFWISLFSVGFLGALAASTTAPRFKVLAGAAAIYYVLVCPVAELCASLGTTTWNYSALWLHRLPPIIILFVLVGGACGIVLVNLLVRWADKPSRDAKLQQ